MALLRGQRSNLYMLIVYSILLILFHRRTTFTFSEKWPLAPGAGGHLTAPTPPPWLRAWFFASSKVLLNPSINIACHCHLLTTLREVSRIIMIVIYVQKSWWMSYIYCECSCLTVFLNKTSLRNDAVLLTPLENARKMFHFVYKAKQ